MGLRSLDPLYAIINLDSNPAPGPFLKSLLDAGTRTFQVRSKRCSRTSFISFVEHAVGVVRDFEERHQTVCTLIVNDNPEVCAECGADGVHLGQHDLSPRDARAIVGRGRLIGLSTHTLAQVEAALDSGADYLGFGPIFSSPTKSGHAAPTGVENLRIVAARSGLPIVAIGGITAARAPAVFAAGATSVAVISELEQAADLESAVRSFTSAPRAAVSSISLGEAPTGEL